ncbi:Sulfate transport system permease protein CysT [Planctopirus ephydatiae]|jgi:sulfate transport system permease protein|uniref:Sulfate transport system permease protein CysT n=1 Tax=Planctopirus ephydatiae TaxID=2528019 RepID=A0A518GTP8_9PLAN|nr:sulfate ABC transporter permease subunit CysT [Planctopirus ephydatiae]QDV31966.1 Sulfate transport system permease protein CysT [Planctopirus ephydatiae]
MSSATLSPPTGSLKKRRVLPGLGLSLGYSITVLTLLLFIPLAACFAKAATLTPSQFWAAAWSERAQSAYFVTFFCSLIAAIIDSIIGVILAWVLVRYQFFGKRFIDSLIDLPFALPTAVAGLVYANMYAEHGWFGQWLVPWGIHVAFTKLGIILVLVFVGLPFVVRTVQPLLETLDDDLEDAAELLGATRWQTLSMVIFPAIQPALLTGFALTFARAIGEFGSVIFISGNLQYKTEIAPYLIVSRLEEYAYAEATAVAVVLIVISLILLVIINGLERWNRRYD